MKLVVLAMITLFMSVSAALATETVTITTYYPSPEGKYKKITVTDTLVIPVVSSDPASPVDGQIWLNTTA